MCVPLCESCGYKHYADENCIKHTPKVIEKISRVYVDAWSSDPDRVSRRGIVL